MSEGSRITKDGSRKLACDTCRVRKVRCDKASPCSACVATGFSCQTTDRPRTRRKKNEMPKENAIADLANAQVPIQVPTPSSMTSSSRTEDSTTALPPLQSRLNSVKGSVSRIYASLSAGDTLAEEGEGFEGESSLHAHSIAARELIERSLGDTMFGTTNPDIAAAMDSLRRLESEKRSQGSRPKTEAKGDAGGHRTSLCKLTLPPADSVIEVLRLAREKTTITFSFMLAIAPISELTTLCQRVFFNVENYSTTTAVIVHGALYNIYVEFAWSEKDERVKERWTYYATLCRKNLELSLLSLDLMLPATMESIQALQVGVSFAIETSRPGVCRRLLSSAWCLMQSLGWHRYDALKNEKKEDRDTKVRKFWLFYIIDKSVSLRLGQASVIQDYDVDLPLPESEGDPFKDGTRLMQRWTTIAKVQGRMYTQLFSPIALKLDGLHRTQTAQSLLKECMDFKTELDKDSEMQAVKGQKLDFSKGFDIPMAIDIVTRSDEVTYYALTTMLYRAMPRVSGQPYDPPTECLRAARDALACHQSCADVYKENSADCWSMYVHWTILNAPFVPFTVVFCNALTTCDRDDVKRLEQFVDSLSNCDYSESGKNMHRLTSVFAKVAKLYVDAKEQEKSFQEQQQAGSQAYPTTDWAPLDSCLNALGLSGDTMFGTDDMNADLENWFAGNQYMIGLLDQDLSYLDVLPETMPAPL